MPLRHPKPKSWNVPRGRRGPPSLCGHLWCGLRQPGCKLLPLPLQPDAPSLLQAVGANRRSGTLPCFLSPSLWTDVPCLNLAAFTCQPSRCPFAQGSSPSCDASCARSRSGSLVLQSVSVPTRKFTPFSGPDFESRKRPRSASVRVADGCVLGHVKGVSAAGCGAGESSVDVGERCGRCQTIPHFRGLVFGAGIRNQF